jgi:hypothetical protein
VQADEEDADADRVQQMFEDAFKGQLWAGGRCPNVMAELQRAILDGVLDLRSIEAHRLVCLSHNLHVKDLRQTRYFWSFTSTWHAFQALLQPSALAGGADLQRTHTELAIPGGPLSFLMARAAVQAEANRFSLALMSVKQDLEREGRTCKILEAEVKELRGEPQASTRGLTGVQCGRGEGCNAMS